MPSESKSQQRYFGMVRAIQEGKLNPRKVSPKMRQTAKEISPQAAHEFAHTKRQGLPEHVKQAFIRGYLKQAQSKQADFGAILNQGLRKLTSPAVKQMGRSALVNGLEYIGPVGMDGWADHVVSGVQHIPSWTKAMIGPKPFSVRPTPPVQLSPWAPNSYPRL